RAECLPGAAQDDDAHPARILHPFGPPDQLGDDVFIEGVADLGTVQGHVFNWPVAYHFQICKCHGHSHEITKVRKRQRTMKHGESQDGAFSCCVAGRSGGRPRSTSYGCRVLVFSWRSVTSETHQTSIQESGRCTPPTVRAPMPAGFAPDPESRRPTTGRWNSRETPRVRTAPR